MNETQKSTKKLVKFVYKTYYDMGNYFNCFSVIKSKTGKYYLNGIWYEMGAIPNECITYGELKDLLKDITYYILEYTMNDELDYNDIKCKLEKLNENNILMTYFTSDYQDICLFENQEQIKEYIEHTIPEEDKEKALKQIL